MSISRLVCCSMLIVSSWRPMLAEEAPLLWKFSVGDEHHYRMIQNMEMEMTLGAGERKIETVLQQTLDMTWKIEQVNEQGLATLIQTVERVRMDMQAPGQPAMHYDTDSDDPPAGFAAMLVPLFKAMTTEPFRITITPRGEIKTLEVPEALSKAMQSTPGAAMMGDMFSDAGFRKMIQQSSLILPEPKDLEPGYEWTTEAEMKNGQFGQLNAETTYTYLGPREVAEKPLEVFKFALKLEFGEGPGGVQMDVVDQESNGEILFSREAGRLASSKLQQEMEIKISAAGQDMKQKMVQTMVFERIEKNPTD